LYLQTQSKPIEKIQTKQPFNIEAAETLKPKIEEQKTKVVEIKKPEIHVNVPVIQVKPLVTAPPAVVPTVAKIVETKPKGSWFSRLFASKPKKEPEINLKIVEILKESKKRNFEMNMVKEKLISKGFSKQEIEDAIKYLEKTSEKKPEIRQTQTPVMISKPVEMEKPKLTIPTFAEQNINKELVATKGIKTIPYKKEEIKHRPVKVGKELRADKLIENTDNLDRIKSKIMDRKNFWASRVTYEGKGGLV
jgi:hypothetical protein